MFDSTKDVLLFSFEDASIQGSIDVTMINADDELMVSQIVYFDDDDENYEHDDDNDD